MYTFVIRDLLNGENTTYLPDGDALMDVTYLWGCGYVYTYNILGVKLKIIATANIQSIPFDVDGYIIIYDETTENNYYRLQNCLLSCHKQYILVRVNNKLSKNNLFLRTKILAQCSYSSATFSILDAINLLIDLAPSAPK